MGDDHADLLGLSDWVNPLGLPPEATSAITCTPGESAGVVLGGVLVVARVSLERFAVRIGSGPGVWTPRPALGLRRFRNLVATAASAASDAVSAAGQ
jgi:hypothetical protein